MICAELGATKQILEDKWTKWGWAVLAPASANSIVEELLRSRQKAIKSCCGRYSQDQE